MVNRAILPLLVIGTLVGATVFIGSRLWHTEPYAFVMSWGAKGSDDGEFLYVEDLEIDANGHLLITDALFDAEGHFISMWGKGGTRPGEFGNLHGIIVDNEGHVYVGDTANHRIQKFRPAR